MFIIYGSTLNLVGELEYILLNCYIHKYQKAINQTTNKLQKHNVQISQAISCNKLYSIQ